MADVFDELVAGLFDESGDDDALFALKDGQIAVSASDVVRENLEHLVSFERAACLRQHAANAVRPVSDDPEVSEQWAVTFGQELLDEQATRCDAVLRHLADGCFEPQHLDVWMQTFNSLHVRLARLSSAEMDEETRSVLVWMHQATKAVLGSLLSLV